MAEYPVTEDQVAGLLAHLRNAGAVDVPTAEAKPISRDAARQLLDVLLRALKASGQDDIVTRLRIVDGDRADRLDAADEIERLRAAGDTLVAVMRSGSDAGWDSAIDGWCGADRSSSLVRIAERLAAALERMWCSNCDDRRCMDCVFRSPHDSCADDCPTCCAEPEAGRFAERERALIEWEEYKDA